MQTTKSLVWFRQDLRLADNPALTTAAKLGTLLPIYVYDPKTPLPEALGAASKLWLHHSLQALNQSLQNKLNICREEPVSLITKLVKTHAITHVFWNECYEPNALALSQQLKKKLTALNISYQVFHSNYLWHPEAVLKQDQSYYKVFTAYKKQALQQATRAAIAKPKKLDLIYDKKIALPLNTLNLLPQHPWHEELLKPKHVGEQAAIKKLKTFLKNGITGYQTGRNFPGQTHTSRLSPHLHFGEISPQQIKAAIAKHEFPKSVKEDIDCFISELVWREFSCYLLYHFPQLPKTNFNAKFNNFPWKNNDRLLKAWKKGQTGYPIVDAGMRELWQTGTMHNRVRMIVASFLIKNLLIHWRHGERWFWDCLLDADLANNSAGWQWVAGSGADAAPYFRIFNPITQGEKFDKQGDYTRSFVPELAKLPDKYLFKPWEAPKDILANANVILGKTYPKPLVDIPTSRQAALEAYKCL